MNLQAIFMILKNSVNQQFLKLPLRESDDLEVNIGLMKEVDRDATCFCDWSPNLNLNLQLINFIICLNRIPLPLIYASFYYAGN